MAIRNIVKEGSDLLRKPCRPVELFDARLHELLDDMFDTMHDAEGVGIAAPQVGILRRLCIVQVPDGKLYELINPVIKKTAGKQTGAEGCLSLPGRSGSVVRPKRMTVEAADRTGKRHSYTVSGYEAVAFSHEIDHLDGVLFTDKLCKDEGDRV